MLEGQPLFLVVALGLSDEERGGVNKTGQTGDCYVAGISLLDRKSVV